MLRVSRDHIDPFRQTLFVVSISVGGILIFYSCDPTLVFSIALSLFFLITQLAVGRLNGALFARLSAFILAVALAFGLAFAFALSLGFAFAWGLALVFRRCGWRSGRVRWRGFGFCYQIIIKSLAESELHRRPPAAPLEIRRPVHTDHWVIGGFPIRGDRV